MKYFNRHNWFKILNLFEPKKNKTLANTGKNDFIHQTLSRKRRGESFKGHSQNIWYHKNEGDKKGSITSYNEYYSGNVAQTYDINKHQTMRHYQMHGYTPQWLVKKLNEISTEFNILNPYASICLEDNPKIAVCSSDWSLNYSTLHDGFDFTNHYDNILELKQLQLLYRRFRDKIKNEDTVMLKKHCTIHNNEIDNHLLKLNKNYLL